VLRTALGLVDVQLVDHLIVAGAQTLSFARQGLL
jgi:DNA repair protein RadC